MNRTNDSNDDYELESHQLDQVTTSQMACDGDLNMKRRRISLEISQWFVNNFEENENVSFCRSEIYAYYILHCTKEELIIVNTATFGKLVRDTFPTVCTQRLGTRGNSKYHYYGINIKPDSSLYSDAKKRGVLGYIQSPSSTKKRKISPDDADVIPDFPDITFPSEYTLPKDCSREDVDTLQSIYREHCESFLNLIKGFKFATIPALWREFWRTNAEESECEEESFLTKHKLYRLSKCNIIQEFIEKADYLFYESLVNTLIPDALQPFMSPATTKLESFATSLINELKNAMSGCPKDMVKTKVAAVGAFSNTLQRLIHINRLAIEAYYVLIDPTKNCTSSEVEYKIAP